MNIEDVIKSVLELLAGVGLFLVACDTLSSNLQAISSSSLKKLFSKVSNNKLIGVFIGAIATAAIQSSGATNVMVMGFVNANIINLNQASTIIFGSEIGTTLTGQIVALGMFSSGNITSTTIFASLIGIGAFIDIFAKHDKHKKIGGILIGFGMIFVGLSMMSNSMEDFAKLDALKVFLANIDSSLLMILIGAVLTAIVQSSSAMTSIAITMIVSGLISLQQGIYITLGANVGSCVTGIMAALKSSTNAKRTSVLQLIFNIGGVVLVYLIDSIIKTTTSNYSISYFFENAFVGLPQTQLAMFHTIFNIASVAIALPISEKIVSLSVQLVPEGEDNDSEFKLHYFNRNMMSSPSIAVNQIKNEIINMASIAIENFNISMKIITSLNFDDLELFRKNERELNFLNEELVEIISELSRKTINKKDSQYLSSTYRAISDFERIGDYSENIIEYSEHLSRHNEQFSYEAISEIENVSKLINSLYDVSMKTYKSYDEDLFKQASILEDKIDDYTEVMANNHIKRMNNGECNADIGSQYLQLSSDVERIADHLININDKNFILSH